MNCPKCGNQVPEGTTVCPNCGEAIASTNADTQTLTDDFVELDDNDEAVKITENMAPPTLAVEEENLTAGTGELTSASNDESIYAPEEEEKIKQSEAKTNAPQDSVDIKIPSVQEPVLNVDVPTDGSAPQVNEVISTVGTTNQNVEALDSVNTKNKKKLKFSIPKGSKNVPKNLMIIVSIIFLVIGIMLGKAFFSKNYCTTTTRKTVVNEKKNFVSDGKNNVTNVGSFTYTIPTDYIYDKKDKGLLIYNKDDTFRIFISAEKGSYESLSGAKNSMRETLKENDYTVNSVKELKSLDVEFLIFETTTNLVSRMLCFTKATDDYIYYVEIVTVNNNYDYGVLEVVADILKNAKYESISTSMEKIDAKNPSDVLIKAAEEYASLTKNNN